jgi:hypothetical protein
MGKLRKMDTHPASPISPREAVQYTQELVDSLREMAIQQSHFKLAELLGAASAEAAQLADALAGPADSAFS